MAEGSVSWMRGDPPVLGPQEAVPSISVRDCRAVERFTVGTTFTTTSSAVEGEYALVRCNQVFRVVSFPSGDTPPDVLVGQEIPASAWPVKVYPGEVVRITALG